MWLAVLTSETPISLTFIHCIKTIKRRTVGISKVSHNYLPKIWLTTVKRIRKNYSSHDFYNCVIVKDERFPY